MIKKGNSSFTYDNNQNNPLTDTATRFSQKNKWMYVFQISITRTSLRASTYRQVYLIAEISALFPRKDKLRARGAINYVFGVLFAIGK